MKAMQKLLFFFFSIAIFIPQLKGMSLPPPKKYYVSIDSIRQRIMSRTLELVPKGDSINITFGGKELLFKKYEVENSHPFFHSTSSLIHRLNDSTDIELSRSQDISYTADSITIKANFNYIHKHRIITPQSLSYYQDTIVISRNALQGIIYYDIPKTKIKSLYLGYLNNSNKDDKNKESYRTYHGIEAGFCYSKFFPVFFGYNLYGANEFVFNAHNFFIGPKVGINLNLIIFMLGNELVCYSDFNKMMLTYRPYVAFGMGPFKLSIGYNLMMFNKDHFKMNTMSVGINIPFYLRHNN